MPAFKKQKDELKSHYDKWLYFLKHLEHLDDIPEILKEPVFEKAFKIAEIANFNTDEYDAYQKSLLSYRDMVNVMKTKYEEGMEQGIENVVVRCLKQGKNSSEIIEITGLRIDQIEKIKKKMNKG